MCGILIRPDELQVLHFCCEKISRTFVASCASAPSLQSQFHQQHERRTLPFYCSLQRQVENCVVERLGVQTAPYSAGFSRCSVQTHVCAFSADPRSFVATAKKKPSHPIAARLFNPASSVQLVHWRRRCAKTHSFAACRRVVVSCRVVSCGHLPLPLCSRRRCNAVARCGLRFARYATVPVHRCSVICDLFAVRLLPLQSVWSAGMGVVHKTNSMTQRGG